MQARLYFGGLWLSILSRAGTRICHDLSNRAEMLYGGRSPGSMDGKARTSWVSSDVDVHHCLCVRLCSLVRPIPAVAMEKYGRPLPFHLMRNNLTEDVLSCFFGYIERIPKLYRYILLDQPSSI